MLTGNTPSSASDTGTASGRVPLTRKSLALWLAIIGTSLLFLPLFLTAKTIREDNLRLAAALSQAQTAAASVPTLPAEVQRLQATATQLQAQIDQLGPAYRQLVAGHVDWPDILAILSHYDDTQAVLTGVSQTENRLVITGRASNDTAVMAYAKLLENSDRFSRVVIQSITSLATPFATPFATPTQASASDMPQPIFLKQPLLKTFEVADEEHIATFLAKANRYYEVSTVKLAPGVDTFLSVSLMVGATYTNDDIGPGTLASKVSFQAPASNTQVIIRVTNLGQAGPEMNYQLIAQEIIPTATPVPDGTSNESAVGLATSTPTYAPTLAFTPTAVPTASPTATPSPVPTLTATDGTVEFAILVEVKPQLP